MQQPNQYGARDHAFANEQQVVRLLAFIQTIGNWLGKKVILTLEGIKEVPLFQFDPATGKGEWIFESRENPFSLFSHLEGPVLCTSWSST